MTKPKPNGFDQYYGELTSLGNQLYEILDQGKEWSGELVKALNNGGGAIFPHTYFSKCGEQIGGSYPRYSRKRRRSSHHAWDCASFCRVVCSPCQGV